MTAVISWTGISHRYQRSWWDFRTSNSILSNIHLKIQPGERVALVGGSGAGKTTLVRIGLGLVRPSSGTVRLFDQDTSTWSAAAWHQARHQAQILFQSPMAMLHPQRTIHDLLYESAKLHQPDDSANELTHTLLTSVGLWHRRDAYPKQLSGGEQRRAGLARVLMAKPRLLVVDEPTVGLDASLKWEMIQFILRCIQSDCALLVISHDLPMVSLACQRFVVLEHGQMVDDFQTDGPVSEYAKQLWRAGGLI